ncbi:SFRICE_000126 [Gryllus bimaculatus]|nr:SFRICE_000126 [Gryllus bimaculatus]
MSEATTDHDQHEPDWPIRPCEMYKEEYKDCTSFRARFHQYFIYGETLDCTQWKKDYDNCVRWTRDKNVKACKELSESEKKRFNDRMRAHYRNDVWEKRSEPPEDWNKPLPEWMQKNYQGTYLDFKSVEFKKGAGTEERTLCIIL